MLDYDIIDVLRPNIINQVQEKFNRTIEFKAGFQPSSKVGVNSTPTVYYYLLPTRRYGSPHRDSFWDNDASAMRYRETQVLETTIQINTLVPTDLNDLANAITANDLANMVAYVMQHVDFLDILSNNNLCLYRITDIRQSYFESDDGAYENNPSFDVTIQHTQITTSDISIIDKFEANIKRV